MQHEFETLATTDDCKDNDCPEVLRDPSTGRVGVVGYVTTDAGEPREHIAWMSAADWNSLRGTSA